MEAIWIGAIWGALCFIGAMLAGLLAAIAYLLAHIHARLVTITTLLGGEEDQEEQPTEGGG